MVGATRIELVTPYDVKGEICLFIEHYFCLLIADKWLVSAKNLYNLFLQT